MPPNYSDPSPSEPSRDRTPLYALLFLAAVAVVFLTLSWPRLQGARWAARLTQCKNNLKQIGLALDRYHDRHGTFPPAVTYGPDGDPWHSWRTLILPHTEDGRAVYDRYRFDEPWDGLHNRTLIADPAAASLFRCPTESRSGPVTTSYLAVVGEKTLWPLGRGLRRDEIADEDARTLHIVEFSYSGIAWSEPRDLTFESKTFELQTGKAPTVKSRHPSSPYAAYADGSVLPLPLNTSPETVKSLLLRDDGGPEEVP